MNKTKFWKIFKHALILGATKWQKKIVIGAYKIPTNNGNIRSVHFTYNSKMREIEITRKVFATTI